MSREIKFRAWDKEEKIMISADNLAFEEYAPISLLFADAKYHFEVMQFTGLKDKNDKEIYEGDIAIGKRGGTHYVFEVKWDEEDARFLGYTNTGHICYVGQEPSVEVIGNIYENPELLESEVE